MVGKGFNSYEKYHSFVRGISQYIYVCVKMAFDLMLWNFPWRLNIEKM